MNSHDPPPPASSSGAAAAADLRRASTPSAFSTTAAASSTSASAPVLADPWAEALAAAASTGPSVVAPVSSRHSPAPSLSMAALSHNPFASLPGSRDPSPPASGATASLPGLAPLASRRVAAGNPPLSLERRATTPGASFHEDSAVVDLSSFMDDATSGAASAVEADVVPDDGDIAFLDDDDDDEDEDEYDTYYRSDDSLDDDEDELASDEEELAALDAPRRHHRGNRRRRHSEQSLLHKPAYRKLMRPHPTNWQGRGHGYDRHPLAPPLTPVAASFGPDVLAPPALALDSPTLDLVDDEGYGRRMSSASARIPHKPGGSLAAHGAGSAASRAGSTARGRTGSRTPAKSAVMAPAFNSVPRRPMFPYLRDRKERLGWLRWLGDVELETYGKRRFVIALVFYLFCGFVNIVFCNIADSRRILLEQHGIPITSTLPDMGHDVIPHIKIKGLPDYFITTGTAMTTIMLLFHKHRLGLFRRYFYTHGILLLFRSLTIISTTVPDPQDRCRERAPTTDIFRMTSPFAPDTCSDLIFSGHTVVLTMIGLAWADYGPQRAWVRRAMWTLALSGMVSLLAARFHYTVDILLSFALTTLVWRWYAAVTQSPALLAQDPVIRFLERRSSLDDVRAGSAKVRGFARAVVPRSVRATVAKATGQRYRRRRSASLTPAVDAGRRSSTPSSASGVAASVAAQRAVAAAAAGLAPSPSSAAAPASMGMDPLVALGLSGLDTTTTAKSPTSSDTPLPLPLPLPPSGPSSAQQQQQQAGWGLLPTPIISASAAKLE
ncbi:hypothetical protein H9P43_009754 [Blastocladiella emersonii ATCC 22665]|nr:hypothetical protein H9P43_009754 [Blastocladiella emersonii ATCC 22665]